MDVHKHDVRQRSNNVYVLGVFLVFFAFSSRGVGRFKKLAKSIFSKDHTLDNYHNYLVSCQLSRPAIEFSVKTSR